MSDSMCYEGEGRLLRSFEGFWVLMETPRKFMWAMTDEHLSDMASAVNEDADAITKTLDQVLSWAHDILIKVYFEKDLLVAVRLGEILLEAVVTKVEPYCSELRAAKGRILKVVQRLFDGNTPQLDSRYIIGIPWSRRDLKRHWASSVHKRVKVRKSVLPKEASALSGSNLTRISTSLLKGTATIGSLNIGPVSLGENSPKSLEAISLGSSVSSFEDPSNSESEPLTPPILEVGNELNAPARRSGTSVQIDSCELTTWSERSTTSEDSDVVPSDAEDWSIVVGPQIISTAVRPRTKSSSGRKAPSGSRASSPGKNRVGGDLQSYDQEQTLPVLDLESCLHQ